MKPLLKNYILPPLMHLLGFICIPIFLIIWFVLKQKDYFATGDFDEKFPNGQTKWDKSLDDEII